MQLGERDDGGPQIIEAATRDNYATLVVEASKDRPVLVDFWGPRCAPCMQLMPWVDDLAQSTAGRLGVVKVNAAENRRLCVELRVLGLPTFVLYDHGGERLRLSGDDCTRDSILSALRDVGLTDAPQSDPT